MKGPYKLFIVICIVGICGIGFYVARFEFREPLFEVYFFYLNRGRSIFIQTPHGETILIDGGQNSEVLRELTKVFPFYKRRIDRMILTGPAAKNIGGLIDVLERFDVGKVIEPALMGTSTALEAFERVRKRKKVKIEKVIKGDVFQIDGIKFSVLFPDPDFKFNKSSLPELVLKAEFGTTTLVFLGDVSPAIQKSLIPVIGQTYLVEFAHGATKSRVSAGFVEKVGAKVMVSTKREETLHFGFR